MFSALSFAPAQSQPSSAAALPSSGSQGTSQQDLQGICHGVQQRMQAIQSMYSGSFLTYSYVLADSPQQIQQVYNAAYQENVHRDSGKWHEAKVKNPDSQFAYPLPVFGFSALSERAKQQKSHLSNLVAAADTAKSQISNLKSHTERVILAELSNCERRNEQLSVQLAKLMLQIEAFALHNCKASVDFGKQRDLLEKVERISQVLARLQKKLESLRTGQKTILSISAPDVTTSLAPVPTSASSFTTLKESVNRKMDAAYSAVLDRCRSVSAQAMHERLNSRAKDYLADLKRTYINSGPSSSAAPLRMRTMNGFEISACRTLAMGAVGKTIPALIAELEQETQSPALLHDIWQAVGFIIQSASTNSIDPYLRGSVEFLESKFSEEISGLSQKADHRVSRLTDSKHALYAYCRQRMSVGHYDSGWVWFAVFAAFRAGWASVLNEIGSEKKNQIEGIELVCSLLSEILEKGSRSGSADVANQLTPLLDSGRASESTNPTVAAYRTVVLKICLNQFDEIKIASSIPECTALDWIWFELRAVLAVSGSTEAQARLRQVREKVDALPKNYFSDGVQGGNAQLQALSSLYPSLPATTGSGAVSDKSRSSVQLALMHVLTLQFDKAVSAVLKTPTEPFDINDSFHRFALFVSMCLDKFGVMHALESLNVGGSLDTANIVIEASLTISVTTERGLYASAVSSACGKRVVDQLTKLDARRTSTTTRVG